MEFPRGARFTPPKRPGGMMISGLRPDQLLRRLAVAVDLAIEVHEVDCEILPFDVSKFTHSPVESDPKCCGSRIDQRHDPDTQHLGGCLRPRRQRPRRRRAAEEPDELAPIHSITSSASASSDGGTTRSSMRAVCILITRDDAATEARWQVGE